MKTIYSMGKGKYITLDSYGKSNETRRWSVAIALFSLVITTITATALVGVDITDPSPKQHHDIHNRTGY